MVYCFCGNFLEQDFLIVVDEEVFFNLVDDLVVILFEIINFIVWELSNVFYEGIFKIEEYKYGIILILFINKM